MVADARVAIALTVLLIMVSIPVRALADEPATVDKPAQERTYFEFSIATGHPFPAEHIGRYGDNEDIVPATSVLAILEFFFNQQWRVRLAYDLPTTTDKRIIDGEVEEEVIPSSMSAGLTWSPWQFTFLESSRIEFQGTLYGGIVLENEPELFPTWTGRIHLMQDQSTGVGVYFGAMYAFIRNKTGPFYGVSYRF